MLFIPFTIYSGERDELISAAEKGDIMELKRLLDRGADENAKDNSNTTALMIAAYNGHI